MLPTALEDPNVEIYMIQVADADDRKRTATSLLEDFEIIEQKDDSIVLRRRIPKTNKADERRRGWYDVVANFLIGLIGEGVHTPSPMF